MHKLGIGEIKSHSRWRARRRIQVELDEKRPNLGFCVREKAVEAWTLRPRRSVARGPFCVWIARCETGAALVLDESVSANPELCQGFQIALVSA
jgi:hypothetical protein